MNNEQFTDLTDNYTLKKIVYVNSAEYGYAELDLDEHIAIYGNNNAGKTSTLAGTKIMLFPETSFTNCAKKFMFVDKDGEYFDNEDSYDHYFPDSRSFIIMEVRNPHGSFSMVCYRTNNYGYARFFIPVEYAEIRELFSIGDDGELNPEISVKNVAEKCKELDGLRVTDRKELAYLMFGSRLDSPEKSRFCVLPLRDSKKGTIDAFRNIYQLAFDGGSSSNETLPAILATLVEMKRGREKEKLDARLSMLVEDRNELIKQQELLQSLENAKSNFNDVWEQLHTTRESLSDYAKQYHAVSAAIVQFKKNVTPEISHLSTEQKRLGVIYSESKQALKESEGKLRTLRTNFKIKNQDLMKANKNLIAAKDSRNTYKNITDEDLIVDLTNRKKEAKEELEKYQNEGGVASELQSLIKQQNALKPKISSLKGKLSKHKILLFPNLIESHAVSVLNSINPLLSGAEYNLRPEQKETVIKFAGLFGFDTAGLLTLNGSVIHPELKKIEFDEQKQIQEWQLELDDKEAELKEIDGKVSALNERLTTDDIEGLIEDLTTVFDKVSDNLEMIKSLPTLQKTADELEYEVQSLELRGKELAAKVEGDGELKVKVDIDFGNLDEVEKKLIKLNQKSQDIDEVQTSLDVAKSIYEPPYMEPSFVIEFPDKDCGLKSITKANNFNSHFQELAKRYQMLNLKVSHPDIERHLILNGLQDYERNIRLFFNTFETLEHQKVKLNDEIEGHNSVLNSQLNELREARETVKREVSDIDSSLNENTVSNLSEIALQVEFEPTFLNIMNTLDKHEIDGGSLLDEGFYKTLSKLVDDKYYDKSTGRIRLRDIIKSVKYSFTKQQSGKAEKKKQSGGTTTTITSFVLSVLLDRVSDSYTRLKMPIIVDEIGTLDNLNKKATIDQVSKHGFSLFCATPTYLAAVDRYVGRHVYINRNKLKVPMVESCHMKCIPKFVNRFGEKKHES